MVSSFLKRLIITHWLRKLKYSWRSDIISGLSVAVVSLPQSLANATIAGVPAIIGLYAGFLPTITATIFGSSPILSTGTVAIISFLTYSAISRIAEPFSIEFVEYASFLALLVGCFQLFFSIFKLGRLIRFVSYPVMGGFVVASACIIFITQIHNLLGIPNGYQGNIFIYLYKILQNSGNFYIPSAVFGIWTFVFLLITKRIYPRFPSILFVVIISIVLNALFSFDGHTVGNIPEVFDIFSFSLPSFSSFSVLFIPSLVIAVVAYIEGYSIIREIDEKRAEKMLPDRELFAQGLANISSSLSHAIPVAGSVSRTALTKQTGAQTSLSSIIVGVLSFISIFLFGNILRYLPLSTLAGVVMVTMLGVIHPVVMKKRLDSFPRIVIAVITFFTTLIFSPHIEYGIFVGIFLSIVFLKRSYFLYK